MQLRNLILGVVVGATFVLAACDARPDPDPDEEDAGCIGACQPQPDAGPDAGPGDAGPDAGPTPTEMTAFEAQTMNHEDLPVYVAVRDLMVHTVRLKRDGGGGAFEAEFWASHRDGGAGIYVDKYYNDPPNTYEPKVGDHVDVTGFLYEWGDNRNPSRGDVHRDGYRRVMTSEFIATGTGSTRLAITLHSRGNTVEPTVVADAFTMGADGGSYAARPELQGAYVHIPGPLTLTDGMPGYMLRYNYKPDSGVYLDVARGQSNYNGYEVTGRVAVNDYFVYSTSNQIAEPKETAGCNYRMAAVDGGTVTFTDGIKGVWDTYTQEVFVPNASNGGCASFADCLLDGFIPGEDGGFQTRFINVVWPRHCADMPATVVMP